MKIVDEINLKRQERKKKIIEVSNEIDKYNQKIIEKKKSIKDLEKKYSESLDTNIVSQIAEQKKELDALIDKANMLKGYGNYNFNVSAEDVLEQLENETKHLKLEELKKNIGKAQAAYFEAFEIYDKKVTELSQIKTDLLKVKENIDKKDLSKIDEWFNNKSNTLHPDVESIFYSLAYKEKELILQVRGTVNNLGNSYGRRFFE
jgi:predicted  nucleic acid-binding Zn-ribbon protein